MREILLLACVAWVFIVTLVIVLTHLFRRREYVVDQQSLAAIYKIRNSVGTYWHKQFYSDPDFYEPLAVACIGDIEAVLALLDCGELNRPVFEDELEDLDE